MNNIQKALAFAAASGAATFAMATPVVSDVTMTQDSSRKVTITYKLSEDAVVTLNVLTNATPNAASGWASIGGEAVCNAQGAVWRKVTGADADGNGDYTITWHPDQSWKDESGSGFRVANGCAKAVVTAWSLDNTPNYMVVDISSAAQPNTQRYYPSADFLPGSAPGQKAAVTNNPAYRTSMLVMRKVMAKDVIWTMGSVAEAQRNATREATHQVALTNNYYIGVFEVTQTQWDLVQTQGLAPAYFDNGAYRAMRPVEQVCYNEIRNSANSTADNSAYDWPTPPNPGSFLGLLRQRTGIDFDLPSEAQWEFAARAGNADTKWGTGKSIQGYNDDTNLNKYGRYQGSGGYVRKTNGTTSWYDPPDQSCGTVNGTAEAGSYMPNSWGLYDMAGNVFEWCLDFYAEDISTWNGAVNTESSSYRVRRGGSWKNAAGACRPAYRGYAVPGKADSNDGKDNGNGFRLACRAGLL